MLLGGAQTSADVTAAKSCLTPSAGFPRAGSLATGLELGLGRPGATTATATATATTMGSRKAGFAKHLMASLVAAHRMPMSPDYRRILGLSILLPSLATCLFLLATSMPCWERVEFPFDEFQLVMQAGRPDAVASDRRKEGLQNRRLHLGLAHFAIRALLLPNRSVEPVVGPKARHLQPMPVGMVISRRRSRQGVDEQVSANPSGLRVPFLETAESNQRPRHEGTVTRQSGEQTWCLLNTWSGIWSSCDFLEGESTLVAE
ncbi:unnamed protein product [Protopolystoma xenopodis]|uniref:Uncharacterized protein n=1 Tax=Protopolystoma xenopodis TaxID=117903 RepID=A0A3S4ZR67_9PLAT|nr:unnamed protein product [Protopolystoma xenopodis]